MIILDDNRHRYRLDRFGVDNGLIKYLNPPYETLAVSLSQARNNFRHRIANDLNINRSDVLIFDDFIIDMNEEQDSVDDVYTVRDACPECGTILDDSGNCPICDYGEEDY